LKKINLFILLSNNGTDAGESESFGHNDERWKLSHRCENTGCKNIVLQ